MKGIKKILKKIAVFGLGPVLGIAQRKLYGKNLTVFCYHDVTDAPSDFSRENALHVPPKVFDYQISYIKKNFNVIEPKQLMEQVYRLNKLEYKLTSQKLYSYQIINEPLFFGVPNEPQQIAYIVMIYVKSRKCLII